MAATGNTRYSPAVVNLIISEIRMTGLEYMGYKVAGIKKSTYHRWKRLNPDFKRLVDDAIAEFHKNKATELRNEVDRARFYLESTLRRSCYQVDVTEEHNGAGELVKTVTRRHQVSPPDWYLQHLVLDPADDNDSTTLKVSVSVAQPEQRTDEQIEADSNRWVDDQDEYSDFDDDGNQEADSDSG